MTVRVAEALSPLPDRFTDDTGRQARPAAASSTRQHHQRDDGHSRRPESEKGSHAAERALFSFCCQSGVPGQEAFDCSSRAIDI
jgi:hypothetical protein